jgi:hypothetical protein
MAAQDLCALADVRAFIQKETADTGQDGVISSLITAISTAIITYCDRQIAPADAGPTTHRFRIDNRRVNLAPYDLRTVTTMTFDPTGSTPAVLVAGTDYLLDPPGGSLGGTYLSVILASSLDVTTQTSNVFGYSYLDISGAWGMSSVPVDVKQACIEAVAVRLRRDVATFSTTFNLAEDRLERPEMLPASVRAALAPYLRMTV